MKPKLQRSTIKCENYWKGIKQFSSNCIRIGFRESKETPTATAQNPQLREMIVSS